MIAAAAGDVLAVHGGGLPGDIIRLAEDLVRHDGDAGHVVIITHQDAKGRWIGIQGEPGGVNLVDCTMFLGDSRTRSNHDQPRAMANGQLQVFLAGAAKSLGLGYDWVGIAADVAANLDVPDLAAAIEHLWRWPSDHDLLPGHVVCSSLAAMLYDLPAVGWAHPDLGTERLCLPEDWWQWNDKQQWAKA